MPQHKPWLCGKYVIAARRAANNIQNVVAMVAALSKGKNTLGRNSYIAISKGLKVKIAFNVVGAANLVISNNLNDTINPAFLEERQISPSTPFCQQT